MNDPLNEVQKREVSTMIMDVVSQQHTAQQRKLAESRTTLERMQYELKTTAEEHVTQQQLLNEKSVKDYETMIEETRKAFGLTESAMKAHESKLTEMTTAMKAFEAQRHDTGNQLDVKFAELQKLLEKVEAQTSLSEDHVADQLGSLKAGIWADAKSITDGAERHVTGFVANTSDKFNESQGQLSASIEELKILRSMSMELNGRLSFGEQNAVQGSSSWHGAREATTAQAKKTHIEKS